MGEDPFPSWSQEIPLHENLENAAVMVLEKEETDTVKDLLKTWSTRFGKQYNFAYICINDSKSGSGWTWQAPQARQGDACTASEAPQQRKGPRGLEGAHLS